MKNTCPTCKGSRLKSDILNIKINNKNIYEVTNMSIKDLITFFDKLKLSKTEMEISELIVKRDKISFRVLNNVGLSYLTLSRAAGTLSGGEAQKNTSCNSNWVKT